jgi:hypothetical protein
MILYLTQRGDDQIREVEASRISPREVWVKNSGRGFTKKRRASWVHGYHETKEHAVAWLRADLTARQKVLREQLDKVEAALYSLSA